MFDPDVREAAWEVVERPFACQPDARAKVDELIRTGGDGWKEVTDLYRRSSR